MAENPDSEPIPSSSEITIMQELKDDDGPLPEKRRKLSVNEKPEKLEHRLGGILCCAVCLDLPQAAVYQCTNGHLMCAPCFTHLLADARLRDENASCPNCRVEISKTSASRNLAVEKTVSELPSECKFCAGVFPRHSIKHHEENKCEERQYKFNQIVVDTSFKQNTLLDGLVRIVSSVYNLFVAAFRRKYFVSYDRDIKRRKFRRLTGCRYGCLGCHWLGPAHEASAHEESCSHPRKTAAEVLPVLQDKDKAEKDALTVYTQVLDLLSYEKITFNDLQLKPYRTDEFIHKLYYETSRFSAFGQQWVLKAFVNKHQRDPTQTTQRDITYQLIMKSKATCAVNVQWLVLRGPYGEAKLKAKVCCHTFGEDSLETTPCLLPLADCSDTNRLLSNKAIHFRLIMFLAPK